MKGLKGVHHYLNDVMVYRKDNKIHDCKLQEVLAMIEGAGLQLNNEKCHHKLHTISV